MHANLCGIHKLSYHFVVKKLLNNCGKKSPSEALNGKLSATEAKAKFKSLHDAYRRIINTESLASGSERPTKKSKWQHYDNLSFLRDSCLRKPQRTDVDDDSTTTIDGDAEENRQQSEENKQQNYNKKQSTNKRNFNSALDRIADAFCERNKQAPIALPDPPQNDEVDAIVSVVEQRLRKLPRNTLDNAAQKLFQITYDLIKETEH
ncbi:uncharacterized protein LOC143893544 isoform X2 [Temnothorax americanus]|uniref:uncharacterized protein LOC143893544 isoform X2 n=1 Tax=Temnothorax americanus TaxID=1964332 RepID=UPI0040687004